MYIPLGLIVEDIDMSLGNLPRCRRPLFVTASEEDSLLDPLPHNARNPEPGYQKQNIDPSTHTTPRDANTNKAMQLLHKFQTKRGDINMNVTERPFSKHHRKSRSNKQLVSMVSEQQNKSRPSSIRLSYTSDLENSFCSETSSLVSESAIELTEYAKTDPHRKQKNTNSNIPLATIYLNQSNERNAIVKPIPIKISEKEIKLKQASPGEKHVSIKHFKPIQNPQPHIQVQQTKPKEITYKDVIIQPSPSTYNQMRNKDRPSIIQTPVKFQPNCSNQSYNTSPVYQSKAEFQLSKVVVFENSSSSNTKDRSLHQESNINKSLDLGTPLATSTLQRNKSSSSCNGNSGSEILPSQIVTKKTKKKRKPEIQISSSESHDLSKYIKANNDNTSVKSMEEINQSVEDNNKENYKIELQQAKEVDSEVKVQTSAEKGKDKSTDEKPSKRKRFNKIKGQSGLQTHLLLNNLGDKTPAGPQPVQPNSASAKLPIEKINVESPNNRPIIHYHVTLQNCDGININVSNVDSNNKRLENIDLNPNNTVQRLSWINDPASQPDTRSSITVDDINPIMFDNEVQFGPFTNSSESWSGASSTDTVIAGHAQQLSTPSDFVQVGHNELSCDTRTTMLMTSETNDDYRDDVSEMTCDTMYLVDADAWGCDGLNDDDSEHLSVCKHNITEDNLHHKQLRERYLNQTVSNTAQPFHLNRNSSFTRSVPERFKYRKRSPSSSKSKEFLPPWRSGSTSSVPGEGHGQKISKTSKQRHGRSLSCNIPTDEPTASKSALLKSKSSKSKSNKSKDSKEGKAKIAVHHKDKAENEPVVFKDIKSKTSIASRLFHNLLNPHKSKKEHEREKDNKNVSIHLSKNNEVKSNVVSTDCNSAFNMLKDTHSENNTAHHMNLQNAVGVHNNSDANTQIQLELNTPSREDTIQLQDRLHSSQTPVSVSSDENNNTSAMQQIILQTDNSMNSQESSQSHNNKSSKPTTSKYPNFDKLFNNNNDKKSKPVAKVVPIARVTPQPSNSTTRQITSTAQVNSHAPGSSSHLQTATSHYLAHVATSLSAATMTSYSPSNSSQLSATGVLQSSVVTSSATSISPMYVSPYNRRYTPIFTSSSLATSSNPSSSITSTRLATNVPYSSNTNGNSVQANQSLVTLNQDHVNDNEEEEDTDSSDDDSTLSIDDNDMTVSPAYDDSTLSLLQASPQFVFVDEDLNGIYLIFFTTELLNAKI